MTYQSSRSMIRAIVFSLFTGPALTAMAASPALAQQEYSIQSEALQEQREFIVHLPDGYDPSSEEGYPVLYVLDPDFPEEKDGQLDDIAAKTAKDLHGGDLKSKAIVIGIRNVRRGLDFLPHYYSATIRGEKVDGNGGNTLSFIREELIPYVDEKYKTDGQRVFMAHSWAAQFVAFTLGQSPELFDAYLITSPDLSDGFGDKTYDVLKEIFTQDRDFPDFVYVSVGGAEEEGFIESYQALTSLFKQQLPEKVSFYHEVNAELTHDNNGQISHPKALKLYFQNVSKVGHSHE